MPKVIATAEIAAHVWAVGIQDMDLVVFFSAVGNQFCAEYIQLPGLVADRANITNDIPATGIALGTIISFYNVGLVFFPGSLFNGGHNSFLRYGRSP